MFDSTISKANNGLLLLVALSIHVSLINRLFSLPLPQFQFEELGGGSGVKVRL